MWNAPKLCDSQMLQLHISTLQWQQQLDHHLASCAVQRTERIKDEAVGGAAV
jgi:hypothetical protein